MARRRRTLLAVTVVSAVLAGGGLAASSLVKSPAERAADTAPPPLTLLTAPVTRQVLAQSTVTRGQVYPPTQYNVSPVAASADVTQLYVSRLAVRSGDQVANGQLLAEVSGQPLFVLRGPVPAYRDIKPGSTGPDVAELQAALAQLGYGRGGDPSGTYGPGTAEAVTGHYRHLGYSAPTTGAATQQAVDAARKAVEADQQAVDALKAQQAAGAAPAGTGTAGASGSAAPPAAGPEQQLAAARRKLAEDRETLAQAQAVNGPMVPAGEVVFLPELPAVVTAVNAPVGSPVSGPLLSLTGGQLAVTGQLGPAQAAGITPGMEVEILSETTGRTVRGTVAELGSPTTTPPAGRVIAIGGPAAGSAAGPAGANPGAPAQGGPQAPAFVPVQIAPAEPLPPAFSGQNVRITVLRGARPEPVLSVPVAAVFTDAAGQTAVTRVAAAGRRITVPVATGVSANGYVGVNAVGGGELAEGDQVAVGR